MFKLLIKRKNMDYNEYYINSIRCYLLILEAGFPLKEPKEDGFLHSEFTNPIKRIPYI